MVTAWSKWRAASTTRRWWLAVAAASAVVVRTGGAAAQPIPGIDVHWAAPGTCPGAADVQARVRRLLGAEAPSSPRRERIAVDGTVARANGRYRLTLHVSNLSDTRAAGQPAGVTRVFDSESCESLAGAAAVTLVLLARGNPHWDERATSPSGAPAPPASGSASVAASAPPAAAATERPSGPSPPQALTPQAPPPAPAPPSPAPPAPQAPAREAPAATADGRGGARWSAVLRGPLLAVDEGVLPSWAAGVGVGAGLRVNGFEAALTAVLWLPQTDGEGGAGIYQGSYARRTGELAGCYEWPWAGLELGPCVTLALEDVTASGMGADLVGGPGHIAWMTVGLAARARWSPWPWGAVFVRPRLAFNTSRPTFTIDGFGSLYQTPLVTVGLDLGFEWIL